MRRKMETTIRAGGEAQRSSPSGVTAEITIETSAFVVADGSTSREQAEELHKELEKAVSEVVDEYE